MALLRFNCRGRVNKPLPSALVNVLPAIKSNMADLQTYARKINEGLPNEEATNIVEWGNETYHIWFRILMAIPMPIPQLLQDKLPKIRDSFRRLKTYAVNTGEAAFYGKYHICPHDEGGRPCEPEVEI